MTGKTTYKFSPEVRARAVRMVLDHASEHPRRWAAVTSIAAKIGCTPQTLQRLRCRAHCRLADAPPSAGASGAMQAVNVGA